MPQTDLGQNVVQTGICCRFFLWGMLLLLAVSDLAISHRQRRSTKFKPVLIWGPHACGVSWRHEFGRRNSRLFKWCSHDVSGFDARVWDDLRRLRQCAACVFERSVGFDVKKCFHFHLRHQMLQAVAMKQRKHEKKAPELAQVGMRSEITCLSVYVWDPPNTWLGMGC